jgi:hypothetical protein
VKSSGKLSDPQLMHDGELSQCFLAQRYNRGILRCENIALREDLLYLLTEEQQIQGELCQEQLKRG